MSTRIHNLLESHRLESYYNQFIQFGVKDERDFIDGVSDEDLDNMGFTQVEKNRFFKMRDEIGRIRAPAKTSWESFCIHYRYPLCHEPKCIRDLDPAQNTVEDLMLRICHLENVGNSKGVCLYTVDGMPLTDDPFFNTWSLKDRHIENGAELYAIFTPKHNLKQSPAMQRQETPQVLGGEDTVRCHVMLRGKFEIKVDLATDTISSLKLKLANESGIPAHVLHYSGDHTGGETLQSFGVSEESTVFFSLSTFCKATPGANQVFTNGVVPSVQQTQKGLSVFFSSLYAIKSRDSGERFEKVVAYIRTLTGCNPLAQSLYQLLCRNEVVSRTQEIAIVEALYTLFRELLPRLGENRGAKTIEDLDVFENSTLCWAYLISEAQKETSERENYAPIRLRSHEGVRFIDPVRVPGVADVFERAFVVQKIQDGEKLPNCSEDPLRETSLRRATDIEKVLLSVPPFIRTYHLWIDPESAPKARRSKRQKSKDVHNSFQIDIKKTFGSMTEGIKPFPHLMVTPPLLLKDVGLVGPRLVLLSEDELGVYVGKDKATPEMIKVFSCLSGKYKTVDVNVLAAKTGDGRGDHAFVTSRTPKEAILVLVDASFSMGWNCYGSVDIKKIDAVKVLFDNFATRTMAYDFHHVIGLAKFDWHVKTLHTFTETLEKFKDHIHSLQTAAGTNLYDALQHGVSELETVKIKFKDCRLRIICLTDGNDHGSYTKPVDVAAKLINANIIVDAILLGDVENDMLHGISNATGGCCFKPETSIDGLKLFEIETVLSLEMRKPKVKLDPSTLTESVLMSLFASRAYDEFPETSLPKQLDNKVTMPENALKKKICVKRCFMEKYKRIKEELKSLHCDPHPFLSIFPSESDLTFWKMAMEGPPDTPYEKGVFELYCQFGPDYPVKPPLVRFVTRIHHCNINSVGRICHNIFDRAYNAQITMREILDAIYGLLIIPEPEDPLDSILAEDFLTSRDRYDQAAKENTEKNAGTSINDVEKKLVGQSRRAPSIPRHLICPLTRKMFVDPVKTRGGEIYERKAIEKHLKQNGSWDPIAGKGRLLSRSDLKSDHAMKRMAKEHRSYQIGT